MEVDYLVIHLSSHRGLEGELRQQVNKTNREAGILNHIEGRNKHLTTVTKARIYKSVIGPIVTYTAKTRQVQDLENKDSWRRRKWNFYEKSQTKL